MPAHATRLVYRWAACSGLAWLLALSSSASILHSPKFKVDGVVIVWGTQSGDIQADFPQAQRGTSLPYTLQITDTAAAHTSGHHIVQTAQLLAPVNTPQTPVLHALNDTQSSFYVASNTAFNIDAVLANPRSFSTDRLARSRISLKASLGGHSTLAFGQKAQYPHSDGPTGGINTEVQTLGDLAQSKRLFTGNQRTAAASGSIAQQSVQFTLDIQTTFSKTPLLQNQDIVFTVFIP